MIDSFHIAATGMQAQQLNVNVIANNLANVKTTAFKKSRVSFEDLMYQPLRTSNSTSLIRPDVRDPLGVGVAVSGVGKVFSQGQLQNTQRSLDIAIKGDGFFEVFLPDGSQGYLRDGSFDVDEEGMLVDNNGNPLSPVIQLPTDTENVVIGSDGLVQVKLTGEADLTEIGQIELAKFINPTGLTPIGDNLFVPSRSSGDVFFAVPGNDGAGTLAQGFLETSNVNLVEELTNLILAQRAYEMNSRVVRASDEILAIINEMRR